jgi:hypothetical protein
MLVLTEPEGLVGPSCAPMPARMMTATDDEDKWLEALDQRWNVESEQDNNEQQQQEEKEEETDAQRSTDRRQPT